MAGTGLLVFADPAWAHGLGAVALIACAVTVFALAARPAELPAGGRPNLGNTPLVKRVIAWMRSPLRVSTSRPLARSSPGFGACR